jgi:hypothetical protein
MAASVLGPVEASVVHRFFSAALSVKRSDLPAEDYRHVLRTIRDDLISANAKAT